MMATPAALRPAAPASSRRVAAIVATTVVVAAVLLRALDALPGWLRGEPRGVRAFESITALERDAGTQLLLPFYFPATLVWPPQAVYRTRGAGRPTAIVFADRTTGAPRLIVAQCLDGPCSLPARVLPPGRELQRATVDIGDSAALLVRQELPGTGAWTDLTWDQYGRRFVLRMYGDDAELLRIARSMRRGHP
jgi:hypothetical protein